MDAVDRGAVLRVGHSFVEPGASLSGLAARCEAAGWDMVELDVLRSDGRLIVAHDPNDLTLPVRLDFPEALSALATALPPAVRIDVDIKSIGYETEVAAAIAAAGVAERTLVSTMHASSLAVLRREAPRLALGLSVPLARRNYLANPLIRPAAYGMLAYLRRVLPGRVGGVLERGEADAIMAHWGVVTGRLVDTVRGRGAELFVWTVDDPARLPALVGLGVSGVITNRTDLFASAVPSARPA